MEALSATSEGIQVYKDGEWLPLSECKNTYRTWVCPICKTVNVQGVSVCSNAKNHPKNDAKSQTKSNAKNHPKSDAKNQTKK